MSRDKVKRRAPGALTAAAIRYGLVMPSTVAGAASGVVLMAVGGVSAEALLAPRSEEMSTHRKHRTPKQGHLRPTLSPC